MTSSAPPKPIWVRQAEEAKIKSDAATAAAAKAAFDATFSASASAAAADAGTLLKPSNSDSDSDSDSEPDTCPSVGPLDPSRCIVAGAGVSGGASGSPVSFTLTLKDSNGNRIPHSGAAAVTAKISPGPGVGGPDIIPTVKDLSDGTYTLTYLVPKRGNYNVHLSVNATPITGSPFPVFFSTGPTPQPSITPTTALVPMYGTINQTMPNMPNYMVGTGLGMMATGNTGGVILQGAGASLGEVCKEYLYGKCGKVGGECKFGHPPQALLMQVLATAATSMNGALMGPSAAAMAAAQAIVAAQALQAHHAANQKESSNPSGSPDKAAQAETLKRTVQVSNLNPLLTADHLKQLFGYCGTVTDCTITDSKHLAYIEFSKPEGATSALTLNNIDVGARPLNVEMAKSLPVKSGGGVTNTSLPNMMQQAVALQQMQFQQALAMQQAAATQAAAARAATMKSATQAAAARAREISMKLKAEAGLPLNGTTQAGGEIETEKEEKKKERSLSPLKRKSKSRSKSRSRSPVKYRGSRRRSRSKSYSPPIRRRRSPVRSQRYSSSYRERRERDEYSHSGRRDSERKEREKRESERERERRERERRDGERKEREKRESERGERDRRESEKVDGERKGSERRESEKTREHHSSSARRERERRESERSRDRERSRSRERKYGKSEKEESKRGRDEDDKRNHDRVKYPKPDKKERVIEEERDSDTGEERETLPSPNPKSHKRKLDRDDYDKSHGNSRGEKSDKRKLDRKENVMDEERDSAMGEERERETVHSSDSKLRKRKPDRDEYDGGDDYDKRQHRRSHRSDKSDKSKEDYHDKKSERKSHQDASKTVQDSKADRWVDEELLDK